MEFLDFMRVMFDLQEKFPGMSFEVVDNLSGPAVVVNLPVSDSTAALLTDAGSMFAPR